MKSAEDEKGTHQNVARVALVLNVLSEGAESGLRLTDVAKTTGLSKAVAHRLLAGMIKYNLVDYDEAIGRYFLGLHTVIWGTKAGNRFGLEKIAEPALRRLCEKTGDTVYLMLRQANTCYCIARHEGSYPIKTLTMNVGDQRPLGFGAGPLAILSFLPDTAVEGAIIENRAEIKKFGFSGPDIWKLIGETRAAGYLLLDRGVTPGMSCVAVPIRRRDGEAFAAINIVAVSDRMTPERSRKTAEMVLAEVAELEATLGSVGLSMDGVNVIRSRSLGKV